MRSLLAEIALGACFLCSLCAAGEQRRDKRQGAVIGQPCSQSTDCGGQGAYCDSSRRCACLSTYVDINGFCWRKIDPDSAGCQYDQQCSAQWPGATCASGGVCKCANNQPGFLTRDGMVCVNYGQCPTGGAYAAAPGFTCAEGGASATDNSCPETYDCICTDPQCTQRAVCCPTRSLTCLMGQDSGSGGGGGGFQTRYYFNSATGECQTFMYYGAGGNANNFVTVEQCESYCKDYCDRGHALWAGNLVGQDSSGKYVQPIEYCQRAGGVCSDRRYQCTTRGTRDICCPSVSFVCSRQGGLVRTNDPGQVTVTTPYNPGFPTDQSYQRWYFDEGTNDCRPFTWSGGGGNYNNFLTQDACRSFCSKRVCEAGTPLEDGIGGNRPCGSGCPSGYECRSNVCCPTKRQVCTQPMQIGGCFNYVRRWWYNAQTQNCEEFTFGGCNGNDNNFDSYTDCANFCRDLGAQPNCPQGEAYRDPSGRSMICDGPSQNTNTCPANYECQYDGSSYGCCPGKQYTCSLTYNEGTPCKAAVTRYYYNTNSRRCEAFTYRGCGGNSNNFATQNDCNDYCGVGGCPFGGTPYQQFSGVYTICQTAGGNVGTNVGTCPVGFECARVTLVQAIGLPQTTNYYCCPTRASVCKMRRDGGTSCLTTPVTRYNFNSATRRCEQFTFGGCAGNRNNFATQAACMNYCSSADCPAGQVAMASGVGGAPASCQAGVSSCADSRYTCVSSTLFLGGGVCCGSSAPTGSCPAGSNAWIDALTGQPAVCTVNVVGSCSNDYQCIYSSLRNRPFCCGTSAATACPLGGVPYTQGGAVFPCNPAVPNSCSALSASTGVTYNCQARTVVINGVPSTTGACCGPRTSGPNVCGIGWTASLLPNTNTPARCNPNTANVCIAPAICKQQPGNVGVFYCCTSTGTAPRVCPANWSPLLCGYGSGLGRCAVGQNPGDPVICAQGVQSTNCPAPYQCVQGPQSGGVYYCCNGGIAPTQPPVVPTEPCPNPYRSPPTGRLSCSASVPCTVAGYNYCVSTVYGGFCCGAGGGGVSDPMGCPSGTSYVRFNGLPMAIQCAGTSNVGSCPGGARCLQSTTTRNFICCQ